MALCRPAGIFIFATIASLAQERADNQLFRMPPGWTRTDPPGATMLSPSAESPGVALVVLAGRPLQGDFRAMFGREVKGLNGTLRVIEQAPVENRRAPDGTELLAVAARLQGPTGGELVRYYSEPPITARQTG